MSGECPAGLIECAGCERYLKPSEFRRANQHRNLRKMCRWCERKRLAAADKRRQTE